MYDLNVKSRTQVYQKLQEISQHHSVFSLSRQEQRLNRHEKGFNHMGYKLDARYFNPVSTATVTTVFPFPSSFAS